MNTPTTADAGTEINALAGQLLELIRNVPGQQWQPLLDRVLVMPLPTPEPLRKQGHIIVQQGGSLDRNEPLFALVIAVGPGLVTREGMRRPPEVTAGDIVVCVKHAGDHQKHGDLDLLYIKDSDILASVDVEMP